MKKCFCTTVVRVLVVAALLSVTAWAAVQPTVKASASPNVRLNPSQMINMYDGKPKTVTVLDAPQDSTFQWYKDGVLIPAATEKKLTLEGELSDNGIYRCIVTSVTGVWDLECNIDRKPASVTFKVADQNVAPGTFTEEQLRFLQEIGVTSRSAEAAEYGITISYSYSGLQEHVLELLDNGGVTLKLGEKQILDGVVFYPYELAYTENIPESVGQKLKSNYNVTFEEGKGLYIKPVPTIVWSDEAQSEGITATYIGTGVSVQPSVEYFKVTDGISTTIELTDGEKSYRCYAIVNVVGDGAETYRSTIQNALYSRSIDVELGKMFEMSLDLPGKVLADELKKLLFLDWEAMNADLTIDYYAKAVYSGGNTHVGAESEDYVKLTVVPAPLTIKFKNQIIQKDNPLPTLQSLGIGELELEGNAELITNLTNTGELGTLTEQLEALAYQGKIVIGGLPEDSATSGRYPFALQLSGMTENELDDLNPCLDIRFGTSELGIRGPVTIDFKATGGFTLKDADEKYNPDGIFKTFVTTFTGGPVLLTAENIRISEPGWDGDITFLYHDEVDGDSLYAPDNFGVSGNYYVKVTATGDDLFEETVAYALVSVLPAELSIFARDQDIEYGQMLDAGISAIELKGDILSNPIMSGMLEEALPLLLQVEAIKVKTGVEANIAAAGMYTDGIEVVFDPSKLAGSGYESAVANFDIKTVSGDLIVKQKEVGLKWLELTAEELVYDGKAKVVTAEATGIVGGDDCAVTVALVGGNARNAGDNVNAGDFIYEATALSNNNYKLPNDSAAKMSPVYTITRKEVTVSAGSYKVSKVYDGTLTAGTASGELAVSGILDGDSGVTVMAAPEDFSTANVGEQFSVNVALALSGDINNNYVLKETTLCVPCEISKADYLNTISANMTVRANKQQTGLTFDLADQLSGIDGAEIQSVAYGSNEKHLLAGVPSGNGKVVTYHVNNGTVVGDIGVIEVTVSSANYNDFMVEIFVTTIGKDTLTIMGVKMDAEAYTYGGAAVGYDNTGLSISGFAGVEFDVGDLEYVYSGIRSDALTYEESSTAPTYPGSYKLTVRVPKDNPDYSGKQDIFFEVDVKKITRPVQADAVVYNGADQTYGVASTVDYFVTGGVQKDANKNGYDVTIELADPVFTTWDDDTIDNLAHKFIISKKTVTVTVGTYAVSKVYDGSIAAGTGSGALSVSGILESDSSVTVAAVPGEYSDVNVGGQDSVNVALALNGDTNHNYVLTETTLSVPCEITKAVPTVATWPTVQPVYVNDNEVTLNDDGAAESAGSFSLGEIRTDEAGPKTVTLTFTPADSVNYECVEKADYTVTVLKRTVVSVETLDAITNRLYGTAQAELGLSTAVEITTSGSKKFAVPVVWSGYTATELEEQTLTGTLDLSAVEAEVEQPSSTVFASVLVDLQEKSAAGLGFGSVGVIYNGAPIAHTLPDGLEEVASVVYSYEGIGGTVYPASPIAPTHAGTYQVTATITMQPGYAAVSPKIATLTIAPKEVELSWSVLDADALVYNGTAKTLTATAAGLAQGDVCTVLVEPVGDNVNVGSFHYTAKALSNADYTLSAQVDSPECTITAKEVTVTADDMEMQAGSALPKLTYTVEGLLGGDSLSTLPGCTTDANLNRAGVYIITISGAAVGSNYTVVHVDGTLTVTGFPVVIRPVYEVKVAQDIPGGAVRVDRITVYQNETVTLTVRADDGYELDELTVTDGQGNKLDVSAEGGGTYAFRMPADSVAVSARFVSDGSSEICTGESECLLHDYTDLDPAEWYHNGVHYCIENGLMTGFGNGVFGPDESTTRAMVAVILWNLEGNPVVNCAMDFPDVEEDQWYTEAIRWMRAEGIVVGYGDGRFGTDDAITREQLVTILWNYAHYKGIDVSEGEDTNILSYGDAMDVADYAMVAMQWACGAGVVCGKNAPDGTGLILDPAGMGTRVQVATMIMNFCMKVIGR